MSKGKIIVISGTDGCGKATQTEHTKTRFEKDGYQVETLDFPRYYDNFFGKEIGNALAGKYGDWAGTHPKLASMVYAFDRWESSKQIKGWLEEGKIVLLDRYVSANQIHQGGKISDDDERRKFLSWLDKMEHEILEIPRPDLILYLDVPVSVTRKLLVKKGNKESKKYLEGKGDQHEDDENHLENAKLSGLKMVAEMNNWHKIDCTENGQMKSIEAINDKIYEKIKELL